MGQAPLDVYANIITPFSNFDGMDLAYITDWNDYAMDVQLVAGTLGWYLSLQYRFDKLTPYVVAGYLENEFNEATLEAIENSYNAIPAGIPGTLTESLDYARAQINAYTSDLIYQQRTWTLGVRYDLYTNVALKAEWQYFDFKKGIAGQVYWLDEHPNVNNTSMATFVLDVVF